jgi:hypothetical protein
LNLQKASSYHQLISIFANNAAITINNPRLLRRSEEQQRLKAVIEQLHSPRVIHELMKKAEHLAEPGGLREKRTISILFANIRGFSEMSVELPVDEVTVFFGAPERLENISRNALKTAIEMMHFFGTMRENFSQQQPHLGLESASIPASWWSSASVCASAPKKR